MHAHAAIKSAADVDYFLIMVCTVQIENLKSSNTSRYQHQPILEIGVRIYKFSKGVLACTLPVWSDI